VSELTDNIEHIDAILPPFATLLRALDNLDGATINITALIDPQTLADIVHAELLKKESYNVKLGLA
jgi:hypothetical protein